MSFLVFFSRRRVRPSFFLYQVFDSNTGREQQVSVFRSPTCCKHCHLGELNTQPTVGKHSGDVGHSTQFLLQPVFIIAVLFCNIFEKSLSDRHTVTCFPCVATNRVLLTVLGFVLFLPKRCRSSQIFVFLSNTGSVTLLSGSLQAG